MKFEKRSQKEECLKKRDKEYLKHLFKSTSIDQSSKSFHGIDLVQPILKKHATRWSRHGRSAKKIQNIEEYTKKWLLNVANPYICSTLTEFLPGCSTPLVKQAHGKTLQKEVWSLLYVQVHFTKRSIIFHIQKPHHLKNNGKLRVYIVLIRTGL